MGPGRKQHFSFQHRSSIHCVFICLSIVRQVCGLHVKCKICKMLRKMTDENLCSSSVGRQRLYFHNWSLTSGVDTGDKSCNCAVTGGQR